ncbi:hypothetical protein [Pseudanabaena sp. FACHB-2040]|uniref:hypothetical protein n=1 Tax=Pseudanabaena sp. FACHB-2040 TaxID=2692859 RepID=UPI0016866D12|nr:hypothetical protein [Pseudanabaena sp. FACHB-2040]MBD2256759.1 hypothetical protein [Pseudanabaena sp. FACHB-2040]
MTIHKFFFSLKATAKRLAVLLMGVIVLFGFSQTAALANSTPPRTESASNVLVALAASSRFASQAELKNQEPTVSESRLDEMREQRREWQSEVSAAAETKSDMKKESGDSVGETIKNKLNLEEITEENEIVEELRNR